MKTFFKALEELNEYFLNQAETGSITKGNGEYEAVFMAPKCFGGAIQKVICKIKIGGRFSLQNCEWYIFQKEQLPTETLRYDYIMRPISDFPISTLCKIFSVDDEWSLEIHKFATVTI